MNTSLLADLQYGYFYLCYHTDPTHVQTYLPTIEKAVKRYFPHYEVVLRETYADYDGMLVARRFNLGAVANSASALLVPLQLHSNVETQAIAFAQTLLDVESHRSEKILLLNEAGIKRNTYRLDDCLLPDGRKAADVAGSTNDLWEDESTDFTDFHKENAPTPIHKKESDSFLGSVFGAAANFFCGASLNVFTCNKRFSESLNEYCDYKTSDDFLFPDEEDELERFTRENKKDIEKACAALRRIATMAKAENMDPDLLIDFIKGKITLNTDNLSPIVVNRDCKIVLQGFDEVELKLGPAQGALYILLLMHPEGILPKNISDYREQITDIYLTLTHYQKDDNIEETIERLATPGELLNQKFTKINSYLKSVVPNSDSYCIAGKRNTPKFIPLARMENMVTIMPKYRGQ